MAIKDGFYPMNIDCWLLRLDPQANNQYAIITINIQADILT